MAGIQKAELPSDDIEEKGLTDLVESSYPFAIDPMPNLYFTGSFRNNWGMRYRLTTCIQKLATVKPFMVSIFLLTTQSMVARFRWYITK